MAPYLDNHQLARTLERVSELLEARDDNPFRVRSYRRAAGTIDGLDRPAAAIWREAGPDGLRALRGIGPGIAGTLDELLRTGHLRLLDELEQRVPAPRVLSRVPGIGLVLGERISSALGVETLEELEVAAHDGSLEQVPGMGAGRVRGVREALAGMLGRRGRHAATGTPEPRPAPPVDLLLDVDREYRWSAERGELRKIAPRRFNPDRERWLPILRTRRDGWRFTALYSNTAVAHRLGKTHDWVVIFHERGEDGPEGQHTVVTESRGPLRGRRVVRGRERESREHHEARNRLSG